MLKHNCRMARHKDSISFDHCCSKMDGLSWSNQTGCYSCMQLKDISGKIFTDIFTDILFLDFWNQKSLDHTLRSVELSSIIANANDVETELFDGSTCYSWSGLHYKSFDGQFYSFQGNCTYRLAMDLEGSW